MVQKGLLAYLAEYQPKYDLVGPTVDDDLRRIIRRYGREAVLDAVKRETRKKRGRKAEPDWPEIDKILKLDARRLLEGGDPFTERTNYSIATEYTERFPGHNPAATHRRILKKLAEKREIFTLLNARLISENEYSYLAHLSILQRLEQRLPGWGWDVRISLIENAVRDYNAKHGAPDDGMTIDEIERGARSELLDLVQNRPPRVGIFGSLAAPKK